MDVTFDSPHLYYLTQYLPVYRELERRGIGCRFVFYSETGMTEAARRVIRRERLPRVWMADDRQSARYYQEHPADWVVFGNKYTALDRLPGNTRTAMLYHGIGMKSDVYRPTLMEMDIRFVEGPHYTEILEHMFPGRPQLEVGYAKLDPLFGPAAQRPRLALETMGLDPRKPTVLYAPTFYPSSIEMMPDDLPDYFNDMNMIVKPHNFTWSKSRYRSQRDKLGRWQQYPNCGVPDRDLFNLLPFMNSADLMISDASSALFEFAALDKPVIWCDFLKLRWTYRGPLRYRLNRRMDASIGRYADICPHARCFDELRGLVDEQLGNPAEFSARRRAYSARLIGRTDGRVAQRIADYLVAA